MRDLWRSLALTLLLLHVHLTYVVSTSSTEISSSLRSLSPKKDPLDTAPPVFCLDVGIEIAFPSRDVEDAMGSERAASAGKGCIRSSPMNAVVGHLKTSLRTFSLHAVDCVLEPMDVESSTIALLGITSLCSRSNIDVEEDMESWGQQVKRQVEKLVENEKRVSFDQITGMVRHIPISPPYELPSSGSGLPQLILGETLIWSDGEGEIKETSDQTFFTHGQLNVKNDGKTPLHLYRLTLVEKEGKEVGDRTTAFVLPLVAPAVVLPEKSEIVSFKAITAAAVDPSKSYVLYISHNGFRSHVFEGILDGKTFLSREEAVLPQGEDGLFDRFSLDSTKGQSLLSSFPYATWQVGSMAVAVAVGIAVTLYVRRKRHSVRQMGHVIARCVRSPDKKSTQGSGSRSSAKPVSNRVASSRAAISKRGEDHIEMERMPAITMKWKAPPPPAAPVTNKTSLAVPKALETTMLHLDLDRAARLHPKRFESMWDEYVERFQNELTDAKSPNSDMLLTKMKAHGISCMASGTVDGVEKFVFYAKQRNRSWYFLVTVDITVVTTTTVLTVRASSDAAEDLVVQLVDLLQTTIAQSVAS